MRSKKAISAVSAILILSLFPHQEARFLIPCVPLLLTCFRPPSSRVFIASWVIFNVGLGLLMGLYHQGGVIPTQLQLPLLLNNSAPSTGSTNPTRTATVYWWKTYSPPRWLLGDTNTANTAIQGVSSTTTNIEIRDVMGRKGQDMIKTLDENVPRCARARPLLSNSNKRTAGTAPTLRDYHSPILVVTPNSNTYLDNFVDDKTGLNNDNEKEKADKLNSKTPLQVTLVWSYNNHINLDDLDFGDDGIILTLKRVFGRRGLNVWLISRRCE